MPEDGRPLDGEEVLLDGNELAEGHDVLLPRRLLASARTRAARLLHRLLRQRAVHAAGEGPGHRCDARRTRSPTPTPAARGRSTAPPLFYTTVDDAWRPVPGLAAPDRHPRRRGHASCSRSPTSASGVWVSLSRSESYVADHPHSSVLTSEVWLLDAAAPPAEFTVVTPRRQGVEYDVERAGDHLLILHNPTARRTSSSPPRRSCGRSGSGRR